MRARRAGRERLAAVYLGRETGERDDLSPSREAEPRLGGRALPSGLRGRRAALRPLSPPAPTCAHLRALAEAGRGQRVHAAGWAEHREDAGAGDAERGGFSRHPWRRVATQRGAPSPPPPKGSRQSLSNPGGGGGCQPGRCYGGTLGSELSWTGDPRWINRMGMGPQEDEGPRGEGN